MAAAETVELNRSPGAPEEPMDVESTKFDENIWYKKYQLLKRKCSEYEQLNDILFSRAKKIRLMIEKAEAEKRSLMKRLEQFEVVDFPKTKSGYNGRSPDNLSEFDSTLPYTAARVRGELEASKGPSATTLTSATDGLQSTKVILPPAPPPPPLLGPFPNNSQTGVPPIPKLTVSLRPPTATVALSPATITAVPIAVTTATPPSSAPVGKGRKSTKKDGVTTSRGSTKRRRGDIDPNAPKKPSNAFFWFCQDKRAALQEQVKVEGLGGQHDLTKALARLWSETKTEDKKIYYEKYATDKARYDREMEDYHRRKQGLPTTAMTVVPTAGSGGGGGSAAATAQTVQRVPPLLLQIGEEVAAEP